ncbi:DUF4304 domain-containing protein [Sorangium sp. So ce542]|uniref:DUF4304 domain-containing protein n=1 Tax=Sorangium sp. So ce542 TaxID=3133316 RepID=UPI003F62F46F
MTRNRINKFIHTMLSIALTPHRFKRRGDDYVRRIGETAHIINVQRSRWNEDNRVNFTLNCGVHISHVTSAFRNLPEPAQPKLTDCCISVRIGMLTASRLDIWWELGDPDDANGYAKVQQDVAMRTADSVIPFLERFQNEHQVAEFLSSVRTGADELVEPRAQALRMAYAAVIWLKLGNADRCSACIEEAERQSKRTPLEDAIAAFASRWRADWRSNPPIA